jgi:hypothetical protein
LLDLFFNPDDGGSMFLQNAGLSLKYRVLNPEDFTLQYATDQQQKGMTEMCI